MIPVEQFGNHIDQVEANFSSRSYREPLQVAVDDVKQDVRDAFTSSATPDTNTDWPPRKRRGDGHPLLVDTGRLLQAATGGGAGHIERVEDRHADVGVSSSVEYAAPHQYGAPSRNLPRRRYLGASNETLREAAERIADHGLEVF